ncbi:mammalian cell entry protein [Mycolicibacterium novocastrense]|uniref:MCE family protein n=1 Tax=Mycolicibacterium novocastrense TaxID=59813 RepID=UPI000749AD1C|nr:MCE family protein [Mycolicibacterium novocastrense]KUH67422.1 mammalian cell entry protein [Mycolicibacterium novocastrense]KUH75174.1 mammalian cell entry protein [Mycolicibacterium novocastrense]KUH77557.1 mammalian cell entry protein [Mycolicibacterium novocastrense]
MTLARSIRRLVTTVCCAAFVVTGCEFDGVNSLPLPGTVGRGEHADVYRVQIRNVGSLEPNSPVLIGDVVVGSIGKMKVTNWTADIEVSVRPDVVVPANAVATVGQTSLLGSMHLALDPPLGQAPSGELEPGSTIGVDRSSTYPSTEQTLSSLSVVLNGGGLGQMGDIVREFNAALNGREGQIRDLLVRLNDFVGMLDTQRDDITASIAAMNRMSGTFASERDVISGALQRIPPALDVLVKERPRITEALDRLGRFSDTATGLINDTQDDLVRNLANLEPTLRALADVGPDLGTVLAYAPTFPYTQSFIDRAIRGDYMNQFIIFDFTIPRLKRGLFLGTRWGQEGAPMVPAPGDPWYLTYTLDPLKAPITATPTEVAGLPPLVEAGQQQADSQPAVDHASGTAPGPEPEAPAATTGAVGAGGAEGN